MRQSESAKIKIGNFWRGKKHSKERIQQTRLRNTILQGKPVLVYDKNNNFVCEYSSISEAARQLKISIATISLHCSGKRKNGLKYNFRYKDIV
jgi:hypothetical protein